MSDKEKEIQMIVEEGNDNGEYLKNKTKIKLSYLILLPIVIILIILITYQPNKEIELLTTNSDNIINSNSKNDSINQFNEQNNLDVFKESIEILDYKSSIPNSAGGVDCNIVWKNLSDKTIKYVTFTVIPFNRVNDSVIGEHKYKGGSYDLEVTGPIKGKEIYGFETYWSCVWYNSSIDYIKIIKIKIEYIDGIVISTSDINIIKQLGYVRKPNIF